MKPHAETSWLLFPPARTQEKPYPKPTGLPKGAKDSILPPFMQDESDLGLSSSRTQRLNSIPSSRKDSLPPTWWERSLETQRKPSSLSRMDQIPAKASPFDRPTLECYNKIQIPRGRCMSTPQFSAFQESPLSDKRLTSTVPATENNEYDSDDTVVKWAVEIPSLPRDSISPVLLAPYSDGSNKENEPPPDLQVTRKICSVSRHQPCERIASRDLENSRLGPRVTSPLSGLQNGPSSQHHQRDSSPAISPRPFLCRFIPSNRFVTTPLPATPSGQDHIFSEFDVNSQTWTSFVPYGEGRLISRHTLILDLVLPVKHWLTDTVLVPFVVTHGSWLETEIGVHVEKSTVEFPLIEAPPSTGGMRTTLVFIIPKAELTSTLTVNINVSYTVVDGTIEVTLPKFSPISGRLLSDSLYVQDPAPPLAVMHAAKGANVAHGLEWQSLATKSGRTWHAQSPVINERVAIARAFHIKWMIALPFPRLQISESGPSLGWDYALSIGSLSKLAVLCHMHIKVHADKAWDRPLLVVDACTWDMSYFLLNGRVPVSPEHVWYIDLDGSLMLPRADDVGNTGYVSIDIEWEMPRANIDAFDLGINGLILPIIRSHRILRGSVTTSLADALIRLRSPNGGEDLILDACRSALPLLEPLSTLALVSPEISSNYIPSTAQVRGTESIWNKEGKDGLRNISTSPKNRFMNDHTRAESLHSHMDVGRLAPLLRGKSSKSHTHQSSIQPFIGSGDKCCQADQPDSISGVSKSAPLDVQFSGTTRVPINLWLAIGTLILCSGGVIVLLTWEADRKGQKSYTMSGSEGQTPHIEGYIGLVKLRDTLDELLRWAWLAH